LNVPSSIRRALLVVVLTLPWVAAGPAMARDITVRWRYAAPERVAGFRLHLGPAPGQYTRTVDIGKPLPDAEGVFRVRIEVADDGATFVAVSAYDGRGGESPLSNEGVRALAPGTDPATKPALGTPGRPELAEP